MKTKQKTNWIKEIPHNLVSNEINRFVGSTKCIENSSAPDNIVDAAGKISKAATSALDTACSISGGMHQMMIASSTEAPEANNCKSTFVSGEDNQEVRRA